MQPNFKKSEKKRFKYFFLNGDLHKLLFRDKANDQCLALNFTDKERKLYRWSDVRRNMQHAFTVNEAAKLINRSPLRVYIYIYEWGFPYYQRAIFPGGNEKRSRYFFSEDDILKLHDFVAKIGYGPPRKDGTVKSVRVPSREHLIQQLNTKQILYVKDDEGNFVPIWQND